MTPQLEHAIERVASLPESDQDYIAAQILELLDDEKWWDKQFAESQDFLERLADEGLEDLKAGRSELLDLSKL
jgi:hypothetical protein